MCEPTAISSPAESFFFLLCGFAARVRRIEAERRRLLLCTCIHEELAPHFFLLLHPISWPRMPSKKSKRTLRSNLERGYATTSTPRTNRHEVDYADGDLVHSIACELTVEKSVVKLQLTLGGRLIVRSAAACTRAAMSASGGDGKQRQAGDDGQCHLRGRLQASLVDATEGILLPGNASNASPPADTRLDYSDSDITPRAPEEDVYEGEAMFGMEGDACAAMPASSAPQHGSQARLDTPAAEPSSASPGPECPAQPLLGTSARGLSQDCAAGSCPASCTPAWCAPVACAFSSPARSSPSCSASSCTAPGLSYRAAASTPVPISCASPSACCSGRVGFSAASPRDEDYEEEAGGSWGRCALASSPPVAMTSQVAWPELSSSVGSHDGSGLPSAARALTAAGAAAITRVDDSISEGNTPGGSGGENLTAATDEEHGRSEGTCDVGLAPDHEDGEEDEGVLCAICHGSIKPNEVALVAGCDHAFCSPCILNWALQKRKCPLCLTGFTHLWLYRRIDGTYNDYLIEESVDLLHCAVWFRKAVSTEFVPGGAIDDEDEPEDYHEMLQWMYGGAAEHEMERDFYDGLQEDLERGRAGRSRAFGQRKYGSGGFIAAGGLRLAARVPQPAPASTFKKKKGFESKKGFEAGGSNCEADAGTGGEESARSAGKKVAGHRKAEKQAMKEAQKEKRRSWVGRGATSA